MHSKTQRMMAPGPFTADQIRSGDPYELSNGHAIFTPPTGRRGGRANLVGGEVVDTDPEVEAAGFDVGVSTEPKALRAPDIAVGNIPNEPGWATVAPPLALEYADTGQDERELQAKISELFEAGTRFIWVIRLGGDEPHVEVHEANSAMRIARRGEVLVAAGVLRNPVPVEALYDRDAAHAATLRNLLNRRGYRDIEHVRGEGREEGREEGRKEARLEGLRDTLRAILDVRGLALSDTFGERIATEQSPERLGAWVTAAKTAARAEDLFDD